MAMLTYICAYVHACLGQDTASHWSLKTDLHLGSNAEEQPLPHTVSGNLPSQSLDPGSLNMMKWRKREQRMDKKRKAKAGKQRNIKPRRESMSDLITFNSYFVILWITENMGKWLENYKWTTLITKQTWWRAEREPIFEAPLSREDPWTVSVAQKGLPSTLRLLNTTKVIHRHQEVLLIVHLKKTGLYFVTFLDIVSW